MKANPFVTAFVVGAVILTILPFIQRLVLRAPPPLLAVPSFELSTLAGQVSKSEGLRGKVWIASFSRGRCAEDCVERLRFFGQALEHVQDTSGRIELVSFVEASGAQEAAGSLGAPRSGWRLLTGTDEALAPLFSAFSLGFTKQSESLRRPTRDLFSSPTLAVVDQNGSVRGYWPADDAGRGHAITAARMFARYGASP